MGMMKRKNKWFVVAVLPVVLAALALSGCSVGKLVSGQAVDITKALPTDAGSKKWNTYRFETAGPFQYQRIAYVLYDDDVTVDVRGIPCADLGKKTMGEVLQDHEAYLKSRMWPGTALVFKQYDREGRAVAYSANEFDMDVSIWEAASSGAKLGLQVVFIDRRPVSDQSE